MKTNDKQNTDPLRHNWGKEQLDPIANYTNLDFYQLLDPKLNKQTKIYIYYLSDSKQIPKNWLRKCWNSASDIEQISVVVFYLFEIEKQKP